MITKNYIIWFLLVNVYSFSCNSSLKKNDKEILIKDEKDLSVSNIVHLDSSEVFKEEGEIYPIRVEKPMNGIGVVIVDFSLSHTGVISVFKSPEMIEEHLRYEITTDELIIDGEQFKGANVSEKLLMEKFQINLRLFYLEYQIFHFDCIKDLGDKYEVLLNPESNLKGYISKEAGSFYNWADYIKKGYILFNPQKNPLRENPSNDSKVVYKYNDYFFEVKEVEGDWIKVKCNNDCKDCDKQNLEGWIKWRESDEFLIQIGFIC
jgi:hypothetical protein